MMKKFFIYIISCSFCFFSCQEKKQNEQLSLKEHAIPTIDLQKEYPSQRILLQDVAEVEYIPLETNKDALLTGIMYLTMDEQFILTNNMQTGDIMLFDRKGKHLNTFNHKGESGEEYVVMGAISMDAEKGEIYVYDSRPTKSCKILVYSFEGKFLRSLSLPKEFYISMFNFDKDHLFIEDFKDADPFKESNKQPNLTPYYLLSKKSGELKQIPIRLEYRVRGNLNSQAKVDETTTANIGLHFPIYPVTKADNQMIISDFATDTIYTYQLDKLTPIALKTNRTTEFQSTIIAGPAIFTDRYLVLNTQDKRIIGEIDLSKGQKQDYTVPDFNKYLLDRQTGEVKKVFWDDANGVKDEEKRSRLEMNNHVLPKNCAMQYYRADFLLEKHEKGELKGELAQLASKLVEDDNPILVLVKFKE